jgi:hypothetical protein
MYHSTEESSFYKSSDFLIEMHIIFGIEGGGGDMGFVGRKEDAVRKFDQNQPGCTAR